MLHEKWADESGSFMAGKSKFQVMKVRVSLDLHKNVPKS
jgi:hypothetical protein